MQRVEVIYLIIGLHGPGAKAAATSMGTVLWTLAVRASLVHSIHCLVDSKDALPWKRARLREARVIAGSPTYVAPVETVKTTEDTVDRGHKSSHKSISLNSVG